ncbi:hypothetical protein BGZ70_007905 [Mortierella alpina]|uniref:Uncharacterized protein n=1 Tax=Mortierella alpina TaxID=64518 RepID=A0A9P6JE28_MORAP|nr:hypothetical protein BGZ70_007905 [Mortierella alpina]
MEILSTGLHDSPPSNLVRRYTGLHDGILRLLLACPFSTCEEPITNTFPKHFYKAVSTTFYFIASERRSIPNEIYYSATPQQARKYKKVTENMIRDLSTEASDVAGSNFRTELNTVADAYTRTTTAELECRLEEQHLLLQRQRQQFDDQTRMIRELRELFATQKQAMEVWEEAVQDQLQHIVTLISAKK